MTQIVNIGFSYSANQNGMSLDDIYDRFLGGIGICLKGKMEAILNYFLETFQ